MTLLPAQRPFIAFGDHHEGHAHSPLARPAVLPRVHGRVLHPGLPDLVLGRRLCPRGEGSRPLRAGRHRMGLEPDQRPAGVEGPRLPQARSCQPVLVLPRARRIPRLRRPADLPDRGTGGGVRRHHRALALVRADVGAEPAVAIR